MYLVQEVHLRLTPDTKSSEYKVHQLPPDTWILIYPVDAYTTYCKVLPATLKEPRRLRLRSRGTLYELSYDSSYRNTTRSGTPTPIRAVPLAGAKPGLRILFQYEDEWVLGDVLQSDKILKEVQAKKLKKASYAQRAHLRLKTIFERLLEDIDF